MWKLKTKTIPLVIGALGWLKKEPKNTLVNTWKVFYTRNAENCTDKPCTHTPKNILKVKHTIISKLIYTFDSEWDCKLLAINQMFSEISVFIS